MRNPNFKREYFFLLTIFISSIILRIWELDQTGFNNDEAIYSGQAATLLGYEEFSTHFSIYRAHPLLLQFVISLFFDAFGVVDTVARAVPVIFGVATVVITYFIAKMLYEWKIAILAALVMSIIPYNVIVSRQVLLDVPLCFFYTLTLFFLVKFLTSSSSKFYSLHLIGIAAGLSFLSKEIGIFALIGAIVFLILTRKIALKGLFVLVSTFLLVTSPYWIPILVIGEAREAAFLYWNWQSERVASHPVMFYLDLIPKDIFGYVLTILCIVSLIYLIKTKEVQKPTNFVLLIWIIIPLLIFQFLAVKGFHFILPIVPSVVLLGISFLSSGLIKKLPYSRILVILMIPMILLSTGTILNFGLQVPQITLAGSGGEPYVREAAFWIDANIPKDQVVLTLDIRTANIIKFYSNNEAFSLHANKNPAYLVVDNPDLYVLRGQVHFLVFEVYLQERYSFLHDEAEKMKDLILRHNATHVHTIFRTVAGDDGEKLIKPSIFIYSLSGG